MFEETRVSVAGAAAIGIDGASAPDWRAIDRALRRIARSESRLDEEKGRLLLAAREAAVHVQLGFATFAEYVERLFGYGPREVRDRVRVAEELVGLPKLTAAFAAGHLPFGAVRELVRVAKPATEEAWLTKIEGRTVREIEGMVSGHRKGDLPDDPTESDLRTFAVRFDLSPEHLALFRDARRAVVDEAGHELTGEEVLAAMCRAALSRGPAAEARTRPPYQVFVTVCEQCDRGWQEGAGERFAVAPAVVEQARCDAEVVRPTATGSSTSRTIPKAVWRLVMLRDHHRCVVPGCRNSEHLEVHHLRYRSHGGDNHPGNLAVLCAGHHAALHEGRLVIAGNPGSFRFTHADGRPWGTAPPETAEAPPFIDDLRSALRGLGLKAVDVQAGIARAATHVGRDAPIEVWLRETLRGYHKPAG
jgi:hypothetical protein